MELMNRGKNLTTSTGTGNLVFGASPIGFQSIGAYFGDPTSEFPYEVHAVDETGALTGQWEVGIGSVSSDGTELIRRLVNESSDGEGVPCDFAAGTKVICVTATASLLGVLGEYGAESITRIYVRSDGDDSNDGRAGTPDRALATISAAVAALLRRYPVRAPLSPSVWIDVGAGTFDGGVGLDSFDFIAAPPTFTIVGVGDTTVLVNTGMYADSVVAVGMGGVILDSLRIDGDAGSTQSLRAFNGGQIIARNVTFGPTAAYATAHDGGSITVESPTLVGAAGGDSEYQGAFSARGQGRLTVYGDLTIPDDLVLTNPLVSANTLGLVRWSPVLVSGGGTLTGQAYQASGNGVIEAYETIPGSIAGTTATGGQYLGPT